MARRGALLCQCVEGISGEILEEYPQLVREHARGQPGVYALYHRRRLYYVGLASALHRRLTAHVRDRHHGKWDHFSLYFVRDAAHLRELEALLIRIAAPAGNLQAARFRNCEDLRPRIEASVREIQDRARKRLFVARAEGNKASVRADRPDEKAPRLAPYLRRLHRRRLRVVHRKRTVRAQVLRDGSIRIAGLRGRFNSPSAAAQRVAGGPRDGWHFWEYERAPDHWVALDELRKK